jgi:penicillin G amidase
MLKSFIKGLLIILVLLGGTLYILFSPSHASALTYRSERISIQRDGANIPTINAPSRLSFFYAMGRVHAEDRLFQMSLKLLVIQGRLSEFLGERPLPMDKFMREVNLDEWGMRAAERLKK